MAQEIIDKELIFVRHARSWGNEENRENAPAHHPDDPPLSPVGQKQAQLLSNRFFTGGIDAIYSSPLLRAVGTAVPTAEKLNLSIELVPFLVETDTKISGTDEKTLASMSDKIIVPYSHYTPIADTEENRRLRAKRSMDYILKKSKSARRIMVVSHGTFLKYVYEYVLGIENGGLFRWSNDNCSITRIILYKNDTPKLKQQNDRLHLTGIEPDYFIFKGDI
ncbi:MAG: histidine phosphatase family protein [Clostridia bacterium]|nr:histidine phosphatase family protein [Clostridia bacterium]